MLGVEPGFIKKTFLFSEFQQVTKPTEMFANYAKNYEEF